MVPEVECFKRLYSKIFSIPTLNPVYFVYEFTSQSQLPECSDSKHPQISISYFCTFWLFLCYQFPSSLNYSFVYLQIILESIATAIHFIKQ